MAKDRRARGNDRVQMVGSEADLMKGPDDMRQSAFAGGMLEMIGSEASLSKRTTPMGEFDKHVRGGREEWTGSMTEMNRTPRRGWDSWPTPISENSEPPESSISGYPTRGRR